jgi:sulfotransferase
MIKKIYFISGQTRSGSELLANILAQNPKFNATTTSGILEILFTIRNTWDNHLEFKATPNEEGKKRVLKAILESYHNTDKIVFDKSRGWLAYLEMAKEILGYEPKVLVPIRDMRDVLSSWEKLYRKNTLNQSGVERIDYFTAQTIQGRCQNLLRNDQPIGLAHNRIIDALQRGWGKNMLFIDYEDLCKNPKQTMEIIYKFLGEEYHEHNFENIKQITQSDDAVYGFKDLHKIKPKLEYHSDWKEILGEWANEYSKLNFWKKEVNK